jgi:hypothetical protein
MYVISPGTAQRDDRPAGADFANVGSQGLSKQPTFSQPYFEDELETAAEAASAVQAAAGGGTEGQASTPVVTGLYAAAGARGEGGAIYRGFGACARSAGGQRPGSRDSRRAARGGWEAFMAGVAGGWQVVTHTFLC